MKTVYTRPMCTACHVLKAELTRKGEKFVAIVVRDEGEPEPPGVWISRQQFALEHPNAKGFPFVVEGK